MLNAAATSMGRTILRDHFATLKFSTQLSFAPPDIEVPLKGDKQQSA